MLRANFRLLFLIFLALTSKAKAQRNYAPNSVLATGSWYRLSVGEPGVYKIDIALLNQLGINTSSLSSSAIRLFGNGGQMLSESNATPRIDDLAEISVLVIDGGDGSLDQTDYLLFYAPGPHDWFKDSANQRFTHRKNLYSDRSNYFLTIGGSGATVPMQTSGGTPGTVVNSFNGRYFHELDSVNFLASGKEWYGEEFSNAPGKSLTETFSFPTPNSITGSPLVLAAQCVARSAGSASNFQFRIGDNPAGTMQVNPVGTGIYDPFALTGNLLGTGIASAEAGGVGGGGQQTIQVSYIPGGFNSQGWLNWIEIFTRQRLSLQGISQVSFRDWSSVGNNAAEFVIADAKAGMHVWDVTDPAHPIELLGSLNGSEYRFVNGCERLREYVAFAGSDLPVAKAEGKIANQNLHSSSPVDNIIITHAPFLASAQRLAQIHRDRDGLRTLVVTIEQLYNEFSSGTPDPTAIRDFAKMYFDRYHSDPANRLRFLTLFGDASYDYRARIINNTNLVPAFQSQVSLDPLSTYTSDDYFGFLEDDEDILSGAIVNDLDIGIGRVPAKNVEEAKNFVDKVESYFNQAAFGPWRNNLSFVADDEDQNLHLQDAEIITQTATTTAPVFDIQKTYLDAFRQEGGSGGSRYPTVNQAISNQLFTGTLIWNFTGHGGPRRLAEETVFDQDMVNNLNNPARLPLFLTATCDFAPYDNPLINSLGENILLRPKTGAIALMTTTRVVFSFSNRVMNNNYMRYALEQLADGSYRTLGDAVREAKNFTYQNSGDITNNRKFTLLGDPALTIAYPRLRVRATRINGVPVSQVDTLSAMERIVIEGEVTDGQGNLLNDFQGNVYPAVFDKPMQIQTLGNDPGSQPVNFTVQSNVLFRGKASVSAGKFQFTFRVPKDINYRYGSGKLSLYAEDGNRDANGSFTGFQVGGTANNADDDKAGPDIKPYLNDEKFVNGGISNETPVLLLKLADSSGINTVGTGIGHDIVATLDNDNRQYFLLNDFYQGELDSYQKGMVKFQLPQMDPGPHTLKIKAWDVVNNSSEVILEFTVAKNEELTLSHVLNYPNPFTTKTNFWFEHNKPGQDLVVRLQIFTLTGRVIKVIQKTINTAGNRSIDLDWDGRDEYGDKIGRGVYLYKLSVTAPGKLKKERIEKLVIF